MVILVGRGVFPGIKHAPYLKWRGPSAPFLDPILTAIPFELEPPYRHGNTCMWESGASFLGVRHAPILRDRTKRLANFLRPTDAHTVWYTSTKLGVIIQMEDGRVCRGQPRRYPKATGDQRARHFFGPSICARVVWEAVTKFRMMIKPLEENFYRVDHASCPGKKFCDANVDARTVCGS